MSMRDRARAAREHSPAPPARAAEKGTPLDPATRSFMERRFGHDFSRIRVHADEDAAARGRSMRARAFTIGSDIWMDPQALAGDTRRSRRLIAHELTHSIQQQRGTTGSAEAAEREAWIASAMAADGGPAGVRQSAPSGVPQLSPLSDDLDAAFKKGDKGAVFDLLRARGPLTPDADTTAWLDATFKPNTDPAKLADDRWLADTIIKHGPEPKWPFSAFEERARLAREHKWPAEPGNIEATFALGKGIEPIKAYYFRGTSDRRAMIIAGVHGTELGGVEVVERLLTKMRAPNAPTPYFSVIVIPQVFPRNVKARARRTSDRTVNPKDWTRDPNRQMPKIGESPAGMTSIKDEPMEKENTILLDIVERFRPERLASAHGTTNPNLASVTSDPRPGRTAEDDKLALVMARKAKAGAARVPGNALGTKDETARYPTSKQPADKGVTLGEYGSHAAGSRPAMNMILIETSGNERSKKPGDARALELQSLADALHEIFLGDPSLVTP